MGIIELPERVFGLESAGVIRHVGPDVKDLKVGDRVACIENRAFSTSIRTTQSFCSKIPHTLSFIEAATMIIPYTTAIHSLITVGGLVKDQVSRVQPSDTSHIDRCRQSVLIHSACGGVGLAAIQISRMLGADIYVTVGSEEKVKFLMETFNIPRNKIFNSRDTSFVDGIKRETKGKGVDVVLNSLSGELLHATWTCVAEYGKMVEIGKRDLIGGGKLDMNTFLANRTYSCVDIDQFRKVPGFLKR
jgi:NADPH:quinone reductase-like Zn-dependent oxidoreductase